VFYGPLERALAPDPAVEPSWSANMSLVYDGEGYRIYQVESHP
jgi:hypothetical protein